MSFHIADVISIHPGECQRVRNDIRLSLNAGRRITNLGSPVVVDCRPANNRANEVSILQRIGQPFENDNASSTSGHHSLSRSVESAAPAVGRKC